MAPVIIGAIAGVLLGWLIAALRSRARHHGGGWHSFSGMGCFSQLLLMVILAAIGALVGAIIGGVF
jgi:hypothetical protein